MANVQPVLVNDAHAQGLSTHVEYDMSSKAVLDRLAYGWYAISSIRSYNSKRTKDIVRERFFKEYHFEATYRGREEEHFQYVEDREILETQFWSTVSNILKGQIKRLENAAEYIRHPAQNPDQLMELDALITTTFEARTGIPIGGESGSTTSERQKHSNAILSQYGANNFKELQDIFSERFPVYRFLFRWRILGQRHRGAFSVSRYWSRYVGLVREEREEELIIAISKSTEFLDDARREMDWRAIVGKRPDWTDYQPILALAGEILYPGTDWRNKALRGLCGDIAKERVDNTIEYIRNLISFAAVLAGIVAMMGSGNLPAVAVLARFLGTMSTVTEVSTVTIQAAKRMKVSGVQEAQDAGFIEQIATTETAGDLISALAIGFVIGEGVGAFGGIKGVRYKAAFKTTGGRKKMPTPEGIEQARLGSLSSRATKVTSTNIGDRGTAKTPRPEARRGAERGIPKGDSDVALKPRRILEDPDSGQPKLTESEPPVALKTKKSKEPDAGTGADKIGDRGTGGKRPPRKGRKPASKPIRGRRGTVDSHSQEALDQLIEEKEKLAPEVPKLRTKRDIAREKRGYFNNDPNDPHVIRHQRLSNEYKKKKKLLEDVQKRIDHHPLNTNRIKTPRDSGKWGKDYEKIRSKEFKDLRAKSSPKAYEEFEASNMKFADFYKFVDSDGERKIVFRQVTSLSGKEIRQALLAGDTEEIIRLVRRKIIAKLRDTYRSDKFTRFSRQWNNRVESFGKSYAQKTNFECPGSVYDEKIVYELDIGLRGPEPANSDQIKQALQEVLRTESKKGSSILLIDFIDN